MTLGKQDLDHGADAVMAWANAARDVVLRIADRTTDGQHTLLNAAVTDLALK